MDRPLHVRSFFIFLGTKKEEALLLVKMSFSRAKEVQTYLLKTLLHGDLRDREFWPFGQQNLTSKTQNTTFPFCYYHKVIFLGHI